MAGNRSILFATALFLVLVIGFLFSGPRSGSRRAGVNNEQDFTITIPPPQYSAPAGSFTHEDPVDAVKLSEEQQREALAEILAREHVTLSSRSTSNKRWFPLDFDGVDTYNPSVLPHPHPLKKDQVIMIAQVVPKKDDTIKTSFLQEIACPATFRNGTMRCLEPPVILPVSSGVSAKCDKPYKTLNYLVGPHDARAFHGPERPYLMYGSPSAHTCLGLWMQELSRLYPWNYLDPLPHTEPFFHPTDLQRPGPSAVREKNWFPFWDRAGEMFIHFDSAPKRAFAKVNATGGVGPDLAPQTYEHDNACIAQHMPKITHPGYEHIQQTSNSLMVTLCRRIEDPTCFESEQNTFIMSILHMKSQFQHDVYDPYVMLFRRTAPFELYGISKKPLWINGRGKPAGSATTGFSKSQDQKFYITTMAWKEFGQSYQGYLNHELYLNFGIDDQRSGSIDIMAEDLLQDLAVCGS